MTAKKTARKFLGRRVDHGIAARDLDVIEYHGSQGLMVTLDCSEFTSHCPVTGQPDFGTLQIHYVPDKFLLETKSAKLYLWSWRGVSAFNELIVDRMATDLAERVKPTWLRVTGRFHTRGGIAVSAQATRMLGPGGRVSAPRADP